MNEIKIFGIVNITEDSFSDGGKYIHEEDAISHAMMMHDEGAICDLGASSSNPDAAYISPELEISRLKPIIEKLKSKNVSISIDSFKTEVQRFALSCHVDYLNDISGFQDPSFYEELKHSDVQLIIMHSLQKGKADRQYANPEDVLSSIQSFFLEKLEQLTKAGIDEERMILDPGMGFFLGSNPDSSFYVLQNIHKLKKEFNKKILISVSRKSFLGNLTERPVHRRGAATLAAEIYASMNGADMIRTHDVCAVKDALMVYRRLLNKTTD